MSYSKEEVVELFEEFSQGWVDGDYWLSKEGVPKFLREKGLIQPKLEVGKWYKTSFNNIYYCTSVFGSHITGYGFDTGIWLDSISCPNHYIATEATEEEVKAALVKEAKRRGIKRDNFYCLIHDTPSNGSTWDYAYGRLFIGEQCCFSGGKWAEPIKESNELRELKKSYKELGEKINKLENK